MARMTEPQSVLYIAAALLAGSFLSPALAQGTSDMRAQAAAIGQTCRADIGKFCSGVERGGGRILACLQSQGEALSPACRAAMPNAAALRAKATAAGVAPR